MFSYIISHPHVFWLSLGGLLLAAEMLGGAGYLLWSGVAAVATGLLSWFIADWSWQGAIFSVLTLIAAWLWWQWTHRQQRGDHSQLNQRNQQLIGQRFRLESALTNNRGHLRIADGSWPVQASEDLPAGCEIEIESVHGITLKIRRWQGDTGKSG